MKYDMTTFFKDGFYTGDVDINVQLFDDVKFPSICLLYTSPSPRD